MSVGAAPRDESGEGSVRACSPLFPLVQRSNRWARLERWHGHEDPPEVRDWLRQNLKGELPA